MGARLCAEAGAGYCRSTASGRYGVTFVIGGGSSVAEDEKQAARQIPEVVLERATNRTRAAYDLCLTAKEWTP